MTLTGDFPAGKDADEYRIEHDSMGEVRVPKSARWAAQTQRAVENFPISGQPVEPALIVALAMIKGAAATVNAEMGTIGADVAAAIAEAANEVADGRHFEQFPIDVFQTGSGTSTKMGGQIWPASDSAKMSGPTTSRTPHSRRTTCSPPLSTSRRRSALSAS